MNPTPQAALGVAHLIEALPVTGMGARPGFGVEGREVQREKGIKKLPDGRWRYSWFFKGRYHRMKAPTKAIAAASLAKIRASIAEGRYLEKEDAQSTRFEEAVKEFLTWGETNVAPGTTRRDRECSTRWLASPRFKGRALSDITAADVEAYRTNRLTTAGKRTVGTVTFKLRPAGKRTCDLDLARLRRLFSLCIKWKLCKENPAKGVDFFNPESKRDRFLTRDEEARILEHCPADIRPAVALAVNTGIRQMELVTLTWGQVNRTWRTLTLTGDKTKSGKTRRVPLNDLALAALDSLPAAVEARKTKGNEPPPGSPVFPVISKRDARDLGRRFVWAAEAAGVDMGETPAQRVTWHTLRHTFASRLVQAGVSLLVVKELLGHSTLVMVMRYAHLANDNLKAAVETLAVNLDLHKTCTTPGEGQKESGQ